MPHTPSTSEKRDFIRMHRRRSQLVSCTSARSSPRAAGPVQRGMQVQAPEHFQVGQQLEVRIDSDHPA